MYYSVKQATHGHGYIVEFTFADGTIRQIDLEPFLKGPIFEPLRAPKAFLSFSVDEEGGTIVWPNGADIAPETLYLGLGPAKPAAEAKKP